MEKIDFIDERGEQVMHWTIRVVRQRSVERDVPEFISSAKKIDISANELLQIL